MMMETVELALKPTNGYILSLVKDTFNGWWELEVGLPIKWIYGNNDMITCSVIDENDKGRLIKISPKVSNITIDYLITYVQLIIETNLKIEEKEIEFKNKFDELKVTLEKQAKDFYLELDVMKEDSFKTVTKQLEIEVNCVNDKITKSVGKQKKNKPDTGVIVDV